MIDLIDKYSTILSLLLALPIGIIGSLISTKLHNKLTFRSKATIIKQIETLEYNLAHAEQQNSDQTGVLVQIGTGIYLQIVASSATIFGFCCLILMQVTYVLAKTREPQDAVTTIVGLIAGIVGTTLVVWGINQVSSNLTSFSSLVQRINNYPEWRNKTEEKITKLQAKLDQAK